MRKNVANQLAREDISRRAITMKDLKPKSPVSGPSLPKMDEKGLLDLIISKLGVAPEDVYEQGGYWAAVVDVAGTKFSITVGLMP